MRNMNRIVLLASLVLAAAGCAVNPVTGKNELSLMSAEQEVAIGQQQYSPSQQSQGGRYYVDADLQVYVKSVGQKLAAVSDRPNLPYDFVVLNNSVPNAWALPGGKIAINRGLLLQLEDESQLAAVLAHEIVHAAARHGASQMSRGQLLGLGVGVLGVATANSEYRDLANLAGQLGASAWMAKYGRDDELESDAYGMEYMARAGYDPMGAVELQETFVKLSAGRNDSGFQALFASHPPSRERVDKNLMKAQTLPKGERFRQRYQRAIAQLKRDEPAYQAQDAAFKSLKNKDANAALMQLDKAIRLQPREGSFWEYRGHAWDMLGNKRNAELAYGTAIEKNPDYFSPYLYRGMLRFEDNNYSTAKSDFQRSHQLFPNGVSAFYLGEVALNTGNSNEAAKYYQQAAQAGGDVGEKAKQRLVAMELQQQPQSFIQHKLSLNSQGYLLILVYNGSPTTMNNIQLRLQDGRGGSKSYSVATLGSGQQTSISSGVGPFSDPQQAAGLSVTVVSAEPVLQ